MTVGSIIRMRRLALGLSQEEVCNQPGVRLNKAHYSEVERDKLVVRVSTFRAICSILGIDFAWVRNDYLKVQDDIAELIELMSCVDENDVVFRRKILSKIVASAKTLRTSRRDQYIARALFNLLECIIIDGSGNYRKLVQHTLSVAKHLKKEELFQLMERLYITSRDQMRFDLLIELYNSFELPKCLSDEQKFTLMYQHSSALYFSGNYAPALEVACKAYASYRKSANRQHLLFLLMRKGNLYAQFKCYEDAKRCYKEAMDLYSRDLSVKWVAECQSNYARILWKQGEYEKAKEQWSETMRYLDDQARLNILPDYCYVELTLGNYEKALEHFKETEKLLHLATDEKLRYRFEADMALHLRNKALFHLKDGEGVQALDCLIRAAEILKGSKLKDELLPILELLMEISLKYGSIIKEDDKTKILDIWSWIK